MLTPPYLGRRFARRTKDRQLYPEAGRDILLTYVITLCERVFLPTFSVKIKIFDLNQLVSGVLVRR